MKSLTFFLLLGVLQLQFFINTANAQYYNEVTEECLVATRLGMLRGKVELSRNGKRYCSYLGVPYSNSPSRFEEAETGQPWNGVRDATNFGPSCPQYQVYTENYIGDENCLFVNIHYPLDDQCEKPYYAFQYDALPVLVHIHGGAFELGAGSEYGPKYIMDGCTIFVSLNYRLGALGFLSTNDGLIPGNLGLKDQVLALKWVQENIECFGGNPNSVTLIGISAGSSCINHLVASPAAKGLFHRAIAQSGAAVLVSRNPTKNARALAARLNCTVDDATTSMDLKECLLAADPKDIVASQRLYKWNTDPFVSFVPTVETLNSTNPIHIVHPIYRLLTGEFNHVPMIMGFTEDEGTLILQAWPTLINPKAVTDLNTKWNELAPIILYYDEESIPQKTKDLFSSEIRSYYFGNNSIGMETAQNLTNLHSDRYFVQGVMDTVELHSRYAPVYPYVFTYKEGLNLVKALGFPGKVATHGSDAQFVFTFQLFPELKKGMPETEFSERLLKLWLEFAKTGNPTETWPMRNLMRPYKNDGIEPNNWYAIDKEMTEIPNYLQDRRKFWRKLGLRAFDCPADY